MNYLHRLITLASAGIFYASVALAQNPGTVTSGAFAIGKGPGVQGLGSLLCGTTQIAIGQVSGSALCAALSGDVTMTAAGLTAIGASKVTNSQLATMAANTTKCNATAGTANPTDCTGSTMRTNLGLVIGTNVQAWDTDLDCLAALASTGVVSRTGGGTCSAGALALSGLATGTQDTVVGYFGSTTASAVAMNNCTGALTYSTTTHTFGCNAAAGTGTVTSVTLGAGYGISVSGTNPVTTSGTFTPAVSLTTASNVLGADVTMVTINVYQDGPSMAQGTTGTWFASGQVTLLDTAATAKYSCKLWDGTTVIASGTTVAGATSFQSQIHLAGTLASPAANIRISCKDESSGSGKMVFNASGASKDSSVYGFRIQ